jgi:O-antigen/teichoic acid export membrane protein
VTLVDQSMEVAPKDHGASRGSLAMLVSFAVTSLFSYAYAVVLTWLLPTAAYGVVGVLQAVLLIGSTAVNSGVPWAVAHRISRQTPDPVSRRYVVTAIWRNAVFGACLGALAVVAMESGGGILGRQPGGVAAVVAATMVVFAITAVLTSVLQGYLRLGYFGAVRAFETVVRFAAAVLLVELGMGVLGAVAGFLLGGAAALGASAVAMRRIPITYARRRAEERMSEYASVASFFLVMVSLAGLTYADLIAVKLLTPASTSDISAGHYQAAVALSRIPVFLTLTAFTAIYPYAARESSSQTSEIGYARLSVKFLALFVVPIGLVLATVPRQAIGLFFPSNYAGSADTLAISGLAVIPLCGVYAWSLLLQASGRLWSAAVVLPLGLVGEVGVLALLVPPWGGPGAAAALGACAAVTLGVLVALGRRVVRASVSPRQSVRYVGTVTALALALHMCPRDGRLTTIAWVVGAMLGYVALLARTRLLTRGDVSTLLGGVMPRGGGPGR